MHSYTKSTVPTTESAKASIQHFKRQKHNVDEKNRDHVAAFLLLRDTNKRVTGQMLEDYLKSRKVTVSSGDRNSLDVWAVPRGNFPDGLPPVIARAERPFGNMSHRSPPEEFYYIDQMIPRQDLGLGVATAGQVVASDVKGSLPGGASATGGQPGIGDAASTAIGGLQLSALLHP